MNTIGPYTNLTVLHGGRRPLYRGTGPGGRPVAIKTVAVEGLDAQERARFVREAEICRSVQNPNVIRVFDAGEADGVLYQAMELLEGADLERVLSSGRKFTWEEKLSIMEQVCAGLAHAHEMKLVHRDIKPANLFLEASGRVKILDFGMVRVANSVLTAVGSALGTLNYMSPEQMQGNAYTPAADVFAAGIVFYQLATGMHPFAKRNQNLSELVSAIVFGAAPPVSDRCPDAPPGLQWILDRALQKKPERRYENAASFHRAIQALASEVRSSRPAPVVEPSERPERTPNIVRPQMRTCAICTGAMPEAAKSCPSCGHEPSAAHGHTPDVWALYGALGGAALLAATLILVMIR